MKLGISTAEIFVPDGKPVDEALSRTTHMCIAAHQDDIEIMAYHGVLQGFGKADKWFTGVIVTNGAGSPRDDVYANYSDDEMQSVRKIEQKKAAYIGDYAAQGLLDYTSAAVKDPNNPDVIEDIKNLILAAKPEVVYTHNLADKHDTHVAVTLRTIAAIRELAPDERPAKLYGCEVWRDLDWMVDTDKTVFQLDGHENIAAALLGVFDSQIAGGKRYDLATFGRRRAHATYYQSHGVDAAQMINFGMDLTPLVHDSSLDIAAFVQERISRFSDDVRARIGKSL